MDSHWVTSVAGHIIMYDFVAGLKGGCFVKLRISVVL